MTAPRLALLLGLAALLASGLACEAETEAPERSTVTPEAVERYRTGVVVPLQEIDAAIAALETAGARADSAGAVAHARVLEGLRRERHQIQTALGGLHGRAPGAFEEATRALDARIAALERRIALAPIELAQSAEELRGAAQAQLLALEQEVAERPALQRARDELFQRRQQIEGALARLGAPDVAFADVRAEVARLFAALFDRLRELEADPAAAPGPGGPETADSVAAPLTTEG